MEKPLVSAVVVAYNKAGVLADSIRSVLRQTYRPLEVLVVDDGSTDTTPQVVRSFGDRVRYLRKENGGEGSARNLGIREARAPWVAFLDGDDLWLPHKLEVQMGVCERARDLLAVQCSAYCVNDRLEVIEARSCVPARDRLLDFLLFNNLPAFASTLVAQRDVLLRLGGFGEDLVILSDWDMACRLARAGTLRSVPDFLVLYRHYPGNRSRNVEIHIRPGVRSLARLFAAPNLDPWLRKREPQVWARFYAMLAGGYARNRNWRGALAWSWKALWTSPAVVPYLAGMPLRRLMHRLRPPPRISFCDIMEPVCRAPKLPRAT